MAFYDRPDKSRCMATTLAGTRCRWQWTAERTLQSVTAHTTRLCDRHARAAGWPDWMWKR